MIELHIDGDVAHVVLNNPAKLNALDEAALRSLDTAYADAEAAGVRALVLRGEGRAFCAGRDISGVDPATDDVRGYLAGLLTPLLKRMARFPAPTFAAAHGACLGVGLGLLIATDVVYVADTAKVGSPFAALGATLDSGGHALFYERLGAHRTLDLIYSGGLLSGEEAVRLGLFSRSLPAAEVHEAVSAAALAAASGPTAAFVESKRIIALLREDRAGLWETVAAENLAQEALRDTADYREGFAAFQEKRRPDFTGR
ncbi:enoyl-CoA hydratase/isomerase family protein [Microbacterium sp. dk485]|uniref:enoyl-CoA hydratase/isomerase family protein n=1 Tax=Microbacterium sp. dk485 TaxID=2560021 RepID=UPI0010731718|nr:enoyl-CoA hydratase-related protein [Microbacterium sp. dk485]TFV85193.1 enoyl-CoA hydratase/isomerase family protein [Microbacterium sp. dk485]